MNGPKLSVSQLIPLCALVWTTLPSCASAEMIAFPENGTRVAITRDGEPHLALSLIGWGPNWQYLGFNSSMEQAGEVATLKGTASVRASGAEVTLETLATQSGPRQLRLDINARTDRDTALTYIVGSLETLSPNFDGGKVLVDLVDGTSTELALPLGRRGLGEQVSRFTYVDGDGEKTTFSLDPACDIGSDGAARIVLVGDQFAADQPRSVSLTIDLPESLTFYNGPGAFPDDPEFGNWYEFRPTNDHEEPGEIGMQDWFDAPAGKYGRIVRQDDKLLYNGRPIKLWGINVCFSSCAPDKALADKRAQFYARYGINSVRLHKYADGAGWAGIQSQDSSAQFEPEGLERMDYFIAALKQQGIFVKLSAHFGSIKIGPADVELVPYAEEFGKFAGAGSRITAPHSAFFYSPELQDLHIRQTVNLLTHTNPHAGLTYAEDPAIAFLEIINEQSILFYSSMEPLKASPTLRKQVAARFSDWLKDRYGDHAGLLEAWGDRALDSFAGEGFPGEPEHLDTRNILPLGNPWYWDPDQLEGSQGYRRQRLLDTMQFLYELQCAAYDRYVSAVRQAGYQGEILGSNWQAGRALSHYYNLHSDARVGLIDRHNYFGGNDGAHIRNASMLRVPGSGMLSAGMQQVSDRPFMLSEWIHVSPTEWGVEGPAIIGAYGMGLQGWDVSYMFQNRDTGGFADRVGASSWEVTAPQVLGIFPAVARQVLRGDIKQAEAVAPRYVHVPSLHEGKLGFEDRVTQDYDLKSFDGKHVPAQTLAVARSVVEFTDEYRDTPMFDPTRYREGDTYTADGGQLNWTQGQAALDGFFTIDTPATKAVVGFADGRECKLGDTTITPHSRFGAIYVTARERDGDLASGDGILIVAVARARNTGMKVFKDGWLLDRGQPPVLMEPVKATIAMARAGDPTVHILDHDGRRTGKTLPVQNGVIEIDGARDQTPYYLVTY